MMEKHSLAGALHSCDILIVMSEQTEIMKSDGMREPFNHEKLLSSITRAGASRDTAEKIAAHLERNELHDGITSREIFEHALALLGKTRSHAAGRYSLKRAVAAFGPSGFPFEKFVGELFRTRGFTVETNRIVRGQCAEHEIDVVAWNDARLIFIEAKFHNELGLKSDLKVALYVKARFDDLLNAPVPWGRPGLTREMFLVTNTKFSETAVSYAACAGISLLGWNEPVKGNLHDMIETAELHPITSLGTLTSSEKARLFERGVVLCKTVAEHEEILGEIGLDSERRKRVREEAERVCHAVITAE
ncbi:MAG: ATP-cone domain-containing protein [Parcubacteria group bacterium Gr01-1014_72]|nr:MAG: ATP-cone domain-containing protein [Parcubacteria group bacterium Gr01-1014_72]